MGSRLRVKKIKRKQIITVIEVDKGMVSKRLNGKVVRQRLDHVYVSRIKMLPAHWYFILTVAREDTVNA